MKLRRATRGHRNRWRLCSPSLTPRSPLNRIIINQCTKGFHHDSIVAHRGKTSENAASANTSDVASGVGKSRGHSTRVARRRRKRERFEGTPAHRSGDTRRQSHLV